MMCTPPWGTSSTVASTGPKTLAMIRVTTEIAREIVGCDTPMISAIASWEVLVRKYINVARTAASGPRILGAKEISVSPSTISTRQLNCVLSRPVIPLPMTARSREVSFSNLILSDQRAVTHSTHRTPKPPYTPLNNLP